MTREAPPNALHVQSVVEERLAALKEEGGLRETATVEWRGAQRAVPVVSMPVDLLVYNPGTHRIRAQRTLDPARDRELDDHPFGVSAQAYVHQLLMGDPSDPTKVDPTFEALRDDLAMHGQSEPGIITRNGVLINGNTRRAALKELGQEHIRVGVLPSDAGGDDLLSIELSLQLRKEHKREYSFMNLLLAIDERVRAGRPAAEIQRDFRMQATTFERCRWILSFVQEAIERSTVDTADGGRRGMRLIDFETDQGKMEELYRAYMTLSLKAPEEAEALREQRLFGIALGKSKTDVRLIEPDFVDKYMSASLPTVAEPTTTPDPVIIPGTSIKVEGPSKKVQALKALTDRALKARAIQLTSRDTDPDVVATAQTSLAEMDAALDKALDRAGKQGRVLKKRYAPVDRLSDVNEALDLVLQAVADARATNTFDPQDLDEGLWATRTRLIKLAQQTSRPARPGEEEVADGDGISWLRGVVQDRTDP